VEEATNGNGGWNVKLIATVISILVSMGVITGGTTFFATTKAAPSQERMDAFDKRMENMEKGQGKTNDILSEMNATMKAQAAQDIHRDKAVASNEAKIDMLSREVGALSDKFALKKELAENDAATEKELAALKAAIDINTREIERLRAAERK
jgi:hypothetical protein